MIDTNILLDVLQNRQPHVEDSKMIWKTCELGLTEGVVSTLSFANIVYVMRKSLDPEQVETTLEMLRLIFRFEDFTDGDMKTAAARKWPDFEDAVQSVIADRIHADYIITRNVKDFKDSKVMALTPAEYFARN